MPIRAVACTGALVRISCDRADTGDATTSQVVAVDNDPALIRPWTGQLADPELEHAYRRFTARSERVTALVTAILILVIDAATIVIDNVFGDAGWSTGDRIVQPILAAVLPTAIMVLAKPRPRYWNVIGFGSMALFAVIIAALIFTGYQMASRGSVVIVAGIMLIYLVGRFTFLLVVVLALVFTAVSVPLWLAVTASSTEFDVPFILAIIVVIHVIGFFEARQAQRERRLLFAAQQRFSVLSTHDDLTGLGNRRKFYDVIADLRRDGTDEPFAVLLADLDGFKEVNDTLGHEAGDELLIIVARRLVAAIPEAHAHIRLGGDEYVAVVPTDADGRAAIRAAEAFIAALEDPIAVAGLDLRARASVGIAVSTDVDSETLLRPADIAMYRAKANGGGLVRYRAGDDRSRTPLRRISRPASP